MWSRRGGVDESALVNVRGVVFVVENWERRACRRVEGCAWEYAGRDGADVALLMRANALMAGDMPLDAMVVIDLGRKYVGIDCLWFSGDEFGTDS